MSLRNKEISCEKVESKVMLSARASFNENGVTFSPPAYIQRYGDVCDILKHDSRWAGHIHKVVDFGCAELSFLTYLKGISDITTILEVDFDEELLMRFHSRAEPLFYDHIFQRKAPLKVSVLKGSVSDPDYRLIGCDAVICIELIEHLDPPAFERLPHNIFGYIRPRLAVITTPNADFNVLFPNLKDGGFRHYDHKFEWTRQQFHDWATNVVQRYPDYSVEIVGVAPGPEGTTELGCCSQMALFINQNYNKRDDVPDADVCHDLISDECATLTKSTDLDSETFKKYDGETIAETAEDPPSADCQVNPDTSFSSDALSLDDETTLVLKTGDCSFYEGPRERPPLETVLQSCVWDCRIWDNDSVCRYYKTIAEYTFPHRIDTRPRELRILEEVMYRIRLYSHYDDQNYDEKHDCWRHPLALMLDYLTEFNVGIQELRTILYNSGYEVVDDMLIYRKLCSLRSSNSSYCADEDYTVDTHIDHTNEVFEENWEEDLTGWKEIHDLYTITDDPESQEEQQPKTITQSDPEKSSQQNDQDGEEESTEKSSFLESRSPVCTTKESVVSPDSPLGQLYRQNRDSADEQMLFDSGYLKSQDSPQSPVCSESFSNDLITPDKDLSEMMQSTVLECIPENHNCPPSGPGCSPKDSLKSAESRRKSLGTSTSTADDSEFSGGSCSMSRPRSLNICTASSEADQPDFKTIKSTNAKSNSPNDRVQRRQNAFSPPDNVHRHFNVPMRVRNHVRRDNFHPAHDGHVRPDFLDLDNQHVAAVDHLNNNVDFEGNNFDEREGVDIRNEGNILNEEYNADLMRQHLDRHNENHLIVGEVENGQAVGGNEEEEAEIVEDVLVYRENFQGEENYGYNPMAMILNRKDTVQGKCCDALDSQPSSPRSDVLPSDPDEEDDHWETNYLLDSIAKTLSLSPEENHYRDVFPDRSALLDGPQPSTSTQKNVPRPPLLWESKYVQRSKSCVTLIVRPSKSSKCKKPCNVPPDSPVRSLFKDAVSASEEHSSDYRMMASCFCCDFWETVCCFEETVRREKDKRRLRSGSTIVDMSVSNTFEPESLINSIENTTEAAGPRETLGKGRGDGTGVHSHPSSHSSGHASMSSTSNVARADLLDSGTVSSEDLLHLPPTNWPRCRSSNLSSSSSNAQLNPVPSVETKIVLPHRRPLCSNDTSGTGSNTNLPHSSHKRQLGLRVKTSDTSGNDADVEVDSESDGD